MQPNPYDLQLYATLYIHVIHACGTYHVQYTLNGIFWCQCKKCDVTFMQCSKKQFTWPPYSNQQPLLKSSIFSLTFTNWYYLPNLEKQTNCCQFLHLLNKNIHVFKKELISLNSFSPACYCREKLLLDHLTMSVIRQELPHIVENHKIFKNLSYYLI